MIITQKLLDHLRIFFPHAQPTRFLLVHIPSQTISLVENQTALRTYPVSTSQFGIGNREGSNRTPTGIHRIAAKIGAGAPPLRIFRNREDTGENWHDGLTEDNLILTRILRLQGLEPGVNAGPGIDSYERYIYIHGTNRHERIGTPMSHGCICMRPADIVELFDAVEEGTIVYIDQR